ncbi:helix-turn-helix domain-containing protein [Leucobacter iarius]|uniref:helix-turn-helix domain-containing protein n=1 Tax=Leucobacter iarius TaxID=333963 RepID=UPI0031E0ECB4
MAESIAHPVRLRCLQLLLGRPMTTAELSGLIPDVSQATVYRHVSELIRTGYVEVVRERRVRGTTERTLALGKRLLRLEFEELSTLNDRELRDSFTEFLVQVAHSFERLVDHDEPALRPLMSISTETVFVNVEDLAAIEAEVTAVLDRYRTPGAGRHRLSNITIRIPAAEV